MATDRRITIDPDDPAVVERVAEILWKRYRSGRGLTTGGWPALTEGTRFLYRADALAVLSALADGDTP